jgi:uncharacterized protein (TIGR03437 family)
MDPMLRLVFALALAQPARLGAAIQELTTDHTGSVLMFQSNGVFRAQPTSGNLKILRWTRDEGLTVFLERAYERRPLVPGRPGDYETNYFNVGSPQVSGDGRRVVLLEQRVLNRTFGGTVNDWQAGGFEAGSEVVVLAAPYGGRSRPALSSNGGFLAVWKSVYNWSGRLVNAGTWSEVPVSAAYPGAFDQGRQRVADDGTLVGVDADHIVRTAGSVKVRASSERAMTPIIDPGGTVIVYETLFRQGVPRRLVAIDTASGRETVLAADPEPDGAVHAGLGTFLLVPPIQQPFIRVPGPVFGHSISADGTRVLAIARDDGTAVRQWLLLTDTDGDRARRLGFVPDGYKEAVLSGDGRVAYATTGLGRLLRIDLATQAIEEILPRTPWIDRWTGVLSEGSVITLVGGGFSESSIVPDQYPALSALGGVAVALDGQPMPITLVAADRIQFQVPWENERRISNTDRHTIEVRVQSDGPLTVPFVTTELGQGGIGAALAFDEVGFFLEDGSPVTLSTPARYGGLLTVHLTGLDQPRMPTGIPFEDGPFRTIDRLQCFIDAVTRVPLVLEGYRPAPGRVGWHELRLSIPDTRGGSVRAVACSAGGALLAKANLPFALGLDAALTEERGSTGK